VGELEIRQDDCNGRVIGRLPLAPATANSGTTTLQGEIRAAGGTHDLCIMFAQPKLQPLWVIDKLTLAPTE
jgi:hexosaminidase